MMAASLETQKVEVESDGSFTIFVEDGFVADASTAIRWCVDRGTFARLVAGELGNDPQVLIALVRNGKEVIGGRQLFPLRAEMAYVAFPSPGEYVLHAWIIRAASGERLTSSGGYGYWFTLFQQTTGECLNSLEFNGLGNGHAEAAITIDREFFAKPPPTWLAKMVNWGYENPPRDQCAWRRRCMAAPVWWPLRMIGLLFFCLFRVCEIVHRSLIAAWWIFWGMRNLKWRAIYDSDYRSRDIYSYHSWIHRPVKMASSDRVVYGAGQFRAGRSVFFYDAAGQPRSFPYWFLAPPALLVGTGLTWLLVIKGGHFGFIGESLCAGGGYVGFVLFASLLIYLFHYITNVGAKAGVDTEEAAAKEAKRLAAEEAKREREKREWALAELAKQTAREQRFHGLACDQIAETERVAKVEALPTPKRTFRLRFFGLKRRVCKPFAR